MEKKKEYSLGDLRVVWKPETCIHSGKCVRALPDVFKPKEKPWIQMDGTSEEQVKMAIDKCPSGALSYYSTTKKENSAMEEKTAETVKVNLIDQGPVIVISPLEVTHPDGRVEVKERRASFCRCGKSNGFPYCDGSHKN